MINLNDYNLTIVKKDGVVCLNGVCIDGFNLNNDMPSDVTFVHWYGPKGYGELQHSEDENGITPPNTKIFSADEYAHIVEEWFVKDDIRNQPYVNTAEDNKEIARVKLFKTDYVYLPDINILNKSEFDTYRAAVREIFFNPTPGEIEWPEEPSPVWE
jgi:hypothetical protein